MEKSLYFSDEREEKKEGNILQKTASEKNLLTGSLSKSVLLFAMPLAFTGILQQLFNAADIAVVGQFTGELGAHCMAAVGACGSLISLLINLFIGISLGSNVVIANFVGARDEKGTSQAVKTSIIISIIGGLLVMAPGLLLSEALLRMMSVPEEVLSLSVTYMQIYLMGLPVILLYNFEAAIFRGIGNTKLPLAALSFAGVINVILNIILVVFFNMNVAGVAIATVASNGISSAILLYFLFKKTNLMSPEYGSFRIYPKLLSRILKIGIPSGIQSSVFSIANVVIQSGFNSLGTIVMAASSAALNLELTTFNLVSAFGQTCTTFTGQAYGAGEIEKCPKILKTCMLEGLAAVFVTAMIIISFGKPILSIFNSNPQVIEYGYLRLSILVCCHLFSVIYETISGYLRGFGISLLPAVLTTFGVCGLRVFWMMFIFPASPTYLTILMVFPISLGSAALLLCLALLIKRPASRLQKSRQEKDSVSEGRTCIQPC